MEELIEFRLSKQLSASLFVLATIFPSYNARIRCKFFKTQVEISFGTCPILKLFTSGVSGDFQDFLRHVCEYGILQLSPKKFKGCGSSDSKAENHGEGSTLLSGKTWTQSAPLPP